MPFQQPRLVFFLQLQVRESLTADANAFHSLGIYPCQPIIPQRIRLAPKGEQLI
jgi:hypothetical protein